MKKRSKFISTMLAAALLLGSSMPVTADIIEPSAAPAAADAAQTSETSAVTDNEQADETSDEENILTEEGQEEAAEEAIISDSVEAEEDNVEVQEIVPEVNAEEDETPAPAANTVEASASVTSDSALGSYSVTATIPEDPDMEVLQVAVWSKTDWQDDLVWYDAVKQSDGTYAVNGNISSHKYTTGIYYFDVYKKMSDGKMDIVESLITSFDAASSDVSFSSNESSYTASISGIVVPGGASKISYAVWSDDGWQDDLKWYDGTYDAASGTSSLTFNKSDFSTFGKYYVDIYGYNKAGAPVFLAGTTYNVNGPSAEDVSLTCDTATGKFSVTASGVTSDTGIQAVQLAVWSDNDWQDDLVWYTASKQSDGTYAVSGDISKHGYDTGKYYFDVYVKDSHGAMGCIESTTYSFDASASDVEINSDDSSYNVSISDIVVPGGVKNIKYAVWSDAGW
jgi:N-acetylmuramoyl-L-alanine amidase